MEEAALSALKQQRSRNQSSRSYLKPCILAQSSKRSTLLSTKPSGPECPNAPTQAATPSPWPQGWGPLHPGSLNPKHVSKTKFLLGFASIWAFAGPRSHAIDPSKSSRLHYKAEISSQNLVGIPKMRMERKM